MWKVVLLGLAVFVFTACGAHTDMQTDNEGEEYIVTNATPLPDAPAAPAELPQSDPVPAPMPATIPVAEIRDKPAWEDVTSFVCHYGAFTEMAGLFDVAILEPRNVTRAQLAWLRERGTFTIGYISVGEDTELRRMDGQGPGGYASFYIDDGEGQPARNNNWNSYFVDAGNGVWQQMVIGRAGELLAMGFDGIFLDTIDTAEIFPDTRPGMAELIRRLREHFPEAKIVANRGFFMLEDFAPYISGIMFEAFTGGYNFPLGEYTVHTGGDLAWTTARADEINRVREDFYFPVFALDYADPEDIETIQMLYDRAWEYDFLPSVSVIMLNRVFWREISPQTQRGVRSGLSRWE